MPKEVERPVPRERTKRGLPAYNAPELAAYRRAMGVTADDLATYLKVFRSAISRQEMARFSPLEAKFGDKLLAGIESIVRNRIDLAEEGARELEAIRGGGKPKRAKT